MGGALTVSARIAAIVLGGVAARGLDPGRLAAQAGFAMALLDDPDARMPLAVEDALWNAAAEACGDPAFGLRLAEAIRPGMFDVLDYVVRTAPTLHAALERLVRYNRLMHDLAEFALEDAPDGVRIAHRFTLPGRWPVRQAAEFTLASLVVIAGQMAGAPLPVLAVELAYPAPADAAPYRRLFGVAPRFEAAGNALVLPRDALLAPVPSADPALSRIVTEHAERLLGQRREAAEDALLPRLRRLILERLGEGEVRLGDVARRLCMSERSLQRALQAEGTRFNALVDAVRKQAALDFMADSRMALGEIAYLLGFSEPSAFHRAFRRWTGTTPLAMRQARRTTSA